MTKQKVIILGSTGMLGSMTLQSFVGSGDFDMLATYRNKKDLAGLKKKYPSVEFRLLDAETATLAEISTAIAGARWVVNCIGVIKPHIHDDNPAETERAILVNATFPQLLGKAAKEAGLDVLTVATDCTYSGEKGNYIEDDVHDALDVYGKTKSLGETHLDNVHHLRCSIIGPEVKGHISLLDWFLSQAKGAEINGFTNHQWNGVTSLHFARLCQGIIKAKIALPHLQHIIPGNRITKADLLKSFAKEFKREDVSINDVEAPKVIDRTLSTSNESLNKQIWKASGYDKAPTIEQMIEELAEYHLAAQHL